MALNVSDILNQMLSAALPQLTSGGAAVEATAKTSFGGIAAVIAEIEKERTSGNLSEDEARKLLDMQKTSTQTALLALEGISLVAVQNAINAALSVVKTAVNTAVGLTLI